MGLKELWIWGISKFYDDAHQFPSLFFLSLDIRYIVGHKQTDIISSTVLFWSNHNTEIDIIHLLMTIKHKYWDLNKKSFFNRFRSFQGTFDRISTNTFWICSHPSWELIYIFKHLIETWLKQW